MNIKEKFKLILFDMDGTLIKGRSIRIISEKKGFNNKLKKVLKSNMEPYQRSIEIAKFLRGFDSREILEIFREIELQDNVQKVINKLKEHSLKIAIVTDSYQLFADDLKNRMEIDFAFANNLLIHNNIITGEIVLNNSLKKECFDGKIYSICKGFILNQLCERLNIKNTETIAVGDGIVDISMIKKAGLGIAFKASEEIQKHADVVTEDLGIILKYI